LSSYPDRGDFAPLIVKHGNASLSRRGRFLGNRSRNNPCLFGRFCIASAIDACRIDEPVTVLNVEVVTRHPGNLFMYFRV
jgi:hypothetical protein